SRSLWGGTNYNPASRFLGEIPEELIDVLREAESPRTRGWNGWDSKHRSPDRHVIRVSRGDRVAHEAFGAGEVVEVVGAGEDAEVIVRFDDEGEKRLILAYANLTRA